MVILDSLVGCDNLGLLGDPAMEPTAADTVGDRSRFLVWAEPTDRAIHSSGLSSRHGLGGQVANSSAQRLARAAAIERDLEKGVRAQGTGYLVSEVARLLALAEDLDEREASLKDRLAVMEATIGALQIPVVREALSVENVAGASSISVSADMPLDAADGFHFLEYDDDGNPFRWTGAAGNSFRFGLQVDRSTELAVELALWPFGRVMSQAPSAIACEVDGVRGVARRSDTSKTDAVYVVALPPLQRSGDTTLMFEVPTGPADDGDDREIGVPFRYLQVG